MNGFEEAILLRDGAYSCLRTLPHFNEGVNLNSIIFYNSGYFINSSGIFCAAVTKDVRRVPGHT